MFKRDRRRRCLEHLVVCLTFIHYREYIFMRWKLPQYGSGFSGNLTVYDIKNCYSCHNDICKFKICLILVTVIKYCESKYWGENSLEISKANHFNAIWNHFKVISILSLKILTSTFKLQFFKLDIFSYQKSQSKISFRRKLFSHHPHVPLFCHALEVWFFAWSC